jgi:uncharacterized protein (TIGR02145 family)
LWFRCKISNSKGEQITANTDLNIIFIKTTSSGYGIDANGVRYLTLQQGQGGTIKGGTMKVALLNLGQSADWTPEGGYVPNDDAGDLGDFYQWGRIADGHQNTVWSKSSTHANQITPYGATPANTSEVISYSTYTKPSYNSTTHQVDAGNYYGKFIYAGSANTDGSYDWYYDSGHDNNLWGNSTVTGTNLSSLTFAWTYSSNNPCPSGWRIPSRYNIGNLYRGSDSPTYDSSAPYDASNAANNNTWAWRAGSNSSSPYAIGGVIITNSTGEQLFLPASGYRLNSSGALSNAGAHGYYWSSTCGSNYLAYYMYFSSSYVHAGSGSNTKAFGFSARCVAEF